jgi:hypothetical protein
MSVFVLGRDYWTKHLQGGVEASNNVEKARLQIEGNPHVRDVVFMTDMPEMEFDQALELVEHLKSLHRNPSFQLHAFGSDEVKLHKLQEAGCQRHLGRGDQLAEFVNSLA